MHPMKTSVIFMTDIILKEQWWQWLFIDYFHWIVFVYLSYGLKFHCPFLLEGFHYFYNLYCFCLSSNALFSLFFSQCYIKEQMNHRDSELEFQIPSFHQTRCVSWERNIISLCLSFLFSKTVGIKLPNSFSGCRIKCIKSYNVAYGKCLIMASIIIILVIVSWRVNIRLNTVYL